MRTNMHGRILTGAFLIIALAVGAFFYKRYHIPPQIDMPVIAVTDLNGQSVSLSEYSGHSVFISFFATWCGPCMKELPELATLRDRLSDQHLAIICISDDPIEKLKQLDARYGGKLTFLHTQNLHDIGIYTYPTNYIYNADGKKIYEKVDPDKWEDPAIIDAIRAKLSS